MNQTANGGGGGGFWILRGVWIKSSMSLKKNRQSIFNFRDVFNRWVKNTGKIYKNSKWKQPFSVKMTQRVTFQDLQQKRNQRVKNSLGDHFCLPAWAWTTAKEKLCKLSIVESLNQAISVLKYICASPTAPGCVVLEATTQPVTADASTLEIKWIFMSRWRSKIERAWWCTVTKVESNCSEGT